MSVRAALLRARAVPNARDARTCRQVAIVHTGNAVVWRTVLKANDE